MQRLLVVLLLLQLRKGEPAISCPHTIAPKETKPLYLLTLVPFPDPRDGTGWDGGLGTVSGARIARDEINNRTDLLPGYHIELIVENIEACSYSEATIGLSNLIKYTVNPPCNPVVAVAGLLCSSHTSILSPVAGHNQFDLVQLSVANSPIFVTQNNRFPHLWRFLGTAATYVDAAIAIMDQFNWKRIGLVYDTGSVFHIEIAKYFRQQIHSTNRTLLFNVGVTGTKGYYFDHVISNLRDRNATILLVSLNKHQSSILLNRTFNGGFNYPNYTFIQIETRLKSLFEEKIINETVYNASQGHIHLSIQNKLQNLSDILVSGETYSTFTKKFKTDFKFVQEIYNEYIITPSLAYASHLYDEVWAFALALNNSLPILEYRNLSIDNYTIGQPEITAVIEEQMANLSFQGASGFIKFDHYHGVSTSLEVWWVSGYQMEDLVGVYNPLNISDFHIRINSSDLPKDRLCIAPEHDIIPLPVTILLYILAGAVIIFTTVQLFLYLHYRHHKAIKATSPYLSLFMFAGCYLLCLAAILNVTSNSFKFEFAPNLIITLCTVSLSIRIVISVNGFSLILLTLFIKLLRVHRIFSSRLKKDLGSYWSNVSLLLIILVLSILPNIITVLVLVFETPKHTSYINSFIRDSQLVVEERILPETMGLYVAFGANAAYFLLFLLLIYFLAIRTRKIRHNNFKDTKKIILFLTLLIVIVCFILPLYIILLKQQNLPAASIVASTGLLVIPMASQLILFLPKTLPVVLEQCFPGARKCLEDFFLTSRQKLLSSLVS